MERSVLVTHCCIRGVCVCVRVCVCMRMCTCVHTCNSNIKLLTHDMLQDEGAASLTLAQTLLSAVTVSVL